MNWKSLFTPGANMSPDEARAFMAEHQLDEYQLLDVRQLKEYEKGHIPGAILVPVKELTERMGELDRVKPTLVYCHSGVRSKAAAQLLQAEGFANIYNMSGGIIAYQGGKVAGDESQGMEYFVGKNFPDVFQMSYAMEEGLKQLYLALEDLVEDDTAKVLLARLAKFEEGHKAMLRSRFPDNAVDEVTDSELLEGGFERQQILDHYRDQITQLEDIIQLAMMLELQALDLYSRLSRTSEDAESKVFFESMAKEEKLHLKYLSDEYDNLLAV
ncbi:MAG: sulfurtransferase [Proteobacteria bacterium]|nr:sulfurtransferase [Pseudomonadota bacterium]MBU1139642.1 sulfurtransferase [Pseudomonadota bacterium]